MNELRQILDAYGMARATGKACALATVTFVEGSSYRRPGARMLMIETGEWVGSVSGGCLERDLLRRAAWAISKGEPELVPYDTRFDTVDTAESESAPEVALTLGAGLGCHGYIEILLEPILAGQSHPLLERLATWTAERRRGGVVLLPGARAIYWQGDESPDLASVAPAFRPSLQNICARLHAQAAGRDLEAEVGPASPAGEPRPARLRVFVEAFAPPIQVTLFGAGHDAVAAAALAVHLGHEVRVVDVRSSMPVPRAAFAGVQEYIQCDSENAAERIRLEPGSAVIVMTHQTEDDRAMLPFILASDPAYVGLLGPRVRGQALLDGIESGLRARVQDRVYFPVGLDLGAETPTEIALAIFAEMRAVLNGRAGQSLRERAGPIHAREVAR